LFADIDNNFINDIPSTWIITKMKNIGEWGAGATPLRSNSLYYNGNIPWLKTGELNNDYVYNASEKITELALKECSLRINNPGDILIAMYGATIGKLGIAMCELTTNQACCGCSPFSFIHNKYLFYYLMYLKDYFTSISFGGAQPNISKEKILETYIAFPNLEEQIKICNSIEKTFKIIDEIDTNYHDIKKYISITKQKILDNIFCENSSYKSYYENEYSLGEILPYEQPGPYIVKSTEYDDSFITPVLTPGKSFILGYTNETDGIYHVNNNKVIIFDDFTTASRLIDFDFKVKSSAMKILKSVDNNKYDIDYLYYLLQTVYVNNDTHKRYWISEYAPLKVKIHKYDEQLKIVNYIKQTYEILDLINSI